MLGPGRVLKCGPRVEAYGSVDELNAALGVARTLDASGWLAPELERLQSRLFHLGAELATTTPQAAGRWTPIADQDVAMLEQWIDRIDPELPPLRNFVLPGGSALGAQLHFARTVCRRAERRVVALQQEEWVSPQVLRYLNRLADLLFVWARWCNHRAGRAETEWRAGAP